MLAAVNLGVLLLATALLTGIAESVAGEPAEERWSLPLANMLVVAVVGEALFLRWSWPATAALLGAYAAWMLAAGLRERLSRPRGPSRRAGDEGPGAGKPRPRLIGQWIEGLTEHDPCVPQELVGDMPASTRKTLAAFLRRGVERRAELGYSWCRFGCGIPDKAMGCRELGDGPWAWPEGLAHYVEAHGVRLPEEFVEHALAHNGLRGLFSRRPRFSDYDPHSEDPRLWLDWCARNRSGALREALAEAARDAQRRAGERKDAAAQRTAERHGATDQECVQAGCQGKAVAGSAYCARCAPDPDRCEPPGDPRAELLRTLNPAAEPHRTRPGRQEGAGLP